MERLRQLESDYLDGTLSIAEAEELAHRLREDPQLQAEFVELYQIHRLLTAELKPSAGEAFQAAVFDELRRDQAEFVGSVMRRIGATRVGEPAAADYSGRQRPDRRPVGPRLDPGSWFIWLRQPAWQALAACLVLAIVGVGLRLWRPEPLHARVGESSGVATIHRGSRALAARDGLALRRGDILETGASASLVLQYTDEATQVKLGSETAVRVIGSRGGKRLELQTGRVEASVAPQPRDRPMVVLTPLAEARVVGTRFSLAARATSTWLVVGEGTVQLSRMTDPQSVKVSAGEYAVAARGLELVSRPTGDADLRDLSVPVRIAWFSEYPEAEDWITTPGFVEQRRTYGDAYHPYRAPPLEGSVSLEVLVRVDELAPGAAWSGEGWGFGVGLRCAGQTSTFNLRTLQQGARGSTLDLSDLARLTWARVPLEHAPGWYRLKLRLDRLSDGQARLRGKLWRPFDLEPEAWMITGTVPCEGPLAAIGLSTHNCACTFAHLSLSFVE